jgi:hypothetical protein
VGTVTMPQKPAARPARRKTRAARYRSQHHDMQSEFPRGVAQVPIEKINPDIASTFAEVEHSTFTHLGGGLGG